MLLALTIVIAFITIYHAGSIALLRQGLFEFLITVEGVVVAELLIYEMLKASEETELKIKIHSKKERLGFSVESVNKTIKDAYPICNDIRYQWEDEDGSLHNVTDLYVGAKPSYFYPFTVTTEQIDGMPGMVFSEAQGIDYIGKIPHEDKADSHNGIIPGLPDVSIRIVGEGIETKRDYEMIDSLLSGLGSVVSELDKSLDLVKKKRK
jgi:hypothetical protein